LSEAGYGIDLARLSVSASRPEEYVAPGYWRRHRSRDRALTRVGADGSFALAGLTPGEHRLEVEGAGVFGMQSVDVISQRETSVELRVRRIPELVLDGDLSRCDGTATVLLAPAAGGEWRESAVVALPAKGSPWGRVGLAPSLSRWRVVLACDSSSCGSAHAELVFEGTLLPEELALELVYRTVEHGR
jgi:hypothetical protein